MKAVLATLNAKYIHSSLALYSLRHYCRQAGFGVTVKEYTINNELLAVLGDIYRERPAVLGLACYIWNIEATLSLAALVKKVLPEVSIVLGGPEVTPDPAEVLRANPAVDHIICGEGEETLAALLAARSDNRPVTGIPGLASRQNGEITACVPQVVKDLATIPFSYDEDDMKSLRGRIVYYESSRGCPYSCQYCLSGVTAGVRFLPLDRVFADLAFLIAHGVRQVKFVDRTFNARPDHYLPILEFLAARDTETNFHLEIAADLLDERALAILRAAPPGRFQFEIGVQSTNPATLAAIKRHNDWPRIVAVVGALRAAGNAHLHLDLIAGLPYEDYAGFARSFNDVYALRPDMLQLGFLKLLKGSGIRAGAGGHGYVFMDGAPYEVLSNNYMSYSEIRTLKIVEEVFNQVYNSGRFAATLEWLTAAWGDAFRLYEAMAAYWEERDLHLVPHAAKTLHMHLAAFCQTVRPDLADDSRHFQKFDAIRQDIRPDGLPWDGERLEAAKTAFWRDEATVGRYLPGYAFTSWREVKKNHHIEVFDLDIPAWLARGELIRRPIAVLFSFRPGDPPWQTVAANDFPAEGSDL